VDLPSCDASQVPGASARLRRRINQDFASPGSGDEVARLVAEVSASERVQAAVVFSASGVHEQLRRAITLAKADWRDVLVAGGLADEDWSQRLEAELGPER